ncbi:MAG: DNA primase [Flavobacteriaceae bacterium]|nr:DNA primase [Flavobacteriaceae bacterium]
MISQHSIEKVFDAARVEEVIGDFVQLKKSGSNLKGLSPFSNERTPSFMVSPVKQIWKDFSSGKGGNAVSFLMEYQQLSYPEAIRYLAKKYAIELEETHSNEADKEAASHRESLYIVNDFAKNFFKEQLLHSDEGRSVGLSYFKKRGFSKESIDTFELGYSPQQKKALADAAEKNGYNNVFLEETGLCIYNERGAYDRFNARVIFPIKNLTGKTLGFGGRILDTQAKAAKYLNSPESEIYHKSKVLYGLYEARQAIAKNDLCYLVEGYTDVIQLHQSGVANVVSSSGTALTTDQIRLISRLTKNITLLFDGDAAGIRAALRGVDLVLETGMNVRICSFPNGEDPDSFAQKNTPEELQSFLEENATDFIRFKAGLLQQETQNDPIKKADAIKDIIESIGKIPDPIQQEIYIKECARIMDLSEEVLFSSLSIKQHKEVLNERKKNRRETQLKAVDEPSEKVNQKNILERALLQSVLLYGHVKEEFIEEQLSIDQKTGESILKEEQIKLSLAEKVYRELQEDEISLSNPIFQTLTEKLCSRILNDDDFNQQEFLRSLEQEELQICIDILAEEDKHPLSDWESQEIYIKTKDKDLANDITQKLLRYRHLLLDEMINKKSESINASENSNQEILEEIKDYIMLKKTISKKIRRVL